jgi:hypothetical protein
VKAKTWLRDSHGLFDYENTQVKTVSLNLHSNCLLFRNQNKHDIKQLTDKAELEGIEEDFKELATLIFTNSKIYFNLDKYYLFTKLDTLMPINNKTLEELQDKIWYVIKNNTLNSNPNINNCYKSNFEYVLQKNDIIKLGRIKFLIRDMNICEGSYKTSVETFKLYQESE